MLQTKWLTRIEVSSEWHRANRRDRSRNRGRCGPSGSASARSACWPSATACSAIFTDAKDTKPLALGKWLIGSLLVHDLIIAPVVIGIGWLLSRFVPAPGPQVRAGRPGHAAAWSARVGVLHDLAAGQDQLARHWRCCSRTTAANLLVLLAIIAAGDGRRLPDRGGPGRTGRTPGRRPTSSPARSARPRPRAGISADRPTTAHGNCGPITGRPRWRTGRPAPRPGPGRHRPASTITRAAGCHQGRPAGQQPVDVAADADVAVQHQHGRPAPLARHPFEHAADQRRRARAAGSARPRRRRCPPRGRLCPDGQGMHDPARAAADVQHRRLRTAPARSRSAGSASAR